MITPPVSEATNASLSLFLANEQKIKPQSLKTRMREWDGIQPVVKCGGSALHMSQYVMDLMRKTSLPESARPRIFPFFAIAGERCFRCQGEVDLARNIRQFEAVLYSRDDGDEKICVRIDDRGDVRRGDREAVVGENE